MVISIINLYCLAYISAMLALRPKIQDELIYSVVYMMFSLNEFEKGRELLDSVLDVDL